MERTSSNLGSEWLRVSAKNPCPVCESDSWCCVSGDGSVVLCMRVKSPKPVEMRNTGTGYIHRLREDTTTPPPKVRRKKREPDAVIHGRVIPHLKRAWRNQGEAVARLAEKLGVAAWTLDDLRVGYADGAWWFPERNHQGLVVGVNRRMDDGTKICLTGSRRGLSYADDWADYAGPILVVEGGSDVAAGLTLSLCVVGRPSNVGGLEYLVRLIGRQKGRKVIVLGERDRKSEVKHAEHNPACRGCALCWPGRHGMVHTVVRLQARIRHPIFGRLLPDDAKDLRGWLNGKRVDPENVEACERLGRSLLRRLR